MKGIILFLLIQQAGGVLQGLVDYFHKGGGVMWLLLIVSIFSLAVIIERFYTLFRLRVNPRKFVVEVIDIIEGEGVGAAMDFCSRNASVVAKICQAALEKAGEPREIIEENVARRASVELAFLDRGMLWLASSSTLAPILGFLGTVTGMIRAFAAVAAAGEVEPTLVASGISEALITTAAGLLIAAPVVVFHTFFSSRINAFSREMEEAANTLIEYILESKVK